MGFRVLGDVGQMGVAYQGDAVVGMQSFVEGNPEAVRRLMRALLEGIKLDLTEDAVTRATLTKYTQLEDPELLTETIDHYRANTRRDSYLRCPACRPSSTTWPSPTRAPARPNPSRS